MGTLMSYSRLGGGSLAGTAQLSRCFDYAGAPRRASQSGVEFCSPPQNVGVLRSPPQICGRGKRMWPLAQSPEQAAQDNLRGIQWKSIK